MMQNRIFGMQDGMLRRPSRRSTCGSLEGDGSRASGWERGGNLRDGAGRSNDSATVRATRRRGCTPAPPSRDSTLFCLSCVRHRVCSREVLWTRERRRVRGAAARSRRCAVSRGQAARSRSYCARSAGTRHLSQAVEPPRRDPSYSGVYLLTEGNGGHPPMRDPILAGLTAFFVEHQYCGELDGGRDNGSIWLQCSCGAHITHPASIPAPIPVDRLQ